MSKVQDALLHTLACKARAIRIKCIQSLMHAGSGHPGGCLSIVDLLTVLFCHTIKRTPDNARSPFRDRFVLSKGHGVPALYALFTEIGILAEEELLTLRKLGSRLQGHPDCLRFPELEASTGSLGQGLSIAQGMALAVRLDCLESRVYCMLGDGEMQEGQVWEALMSAPHYKLNNICAILDHNKSQIDGPIEQIMSLSPLKEKLLAFNWNVLEIDGHNLPEIINAYQQAQQHTQSPTFIIAHTTKGKGVPFMENNIEWHGKAPSEKEGLQAIELLNAQTNQL